MTLNYNAKAREKCEMAELLYKDLSYVIQGVAFDIYKKLGSAHKENVYHNACLIALRNKKLGIEKEKRIEIFYENKKVGTYTPDLVVNDSILIELKAKPFLTKEDIKQFWHYLRCSTYRLGYLINFSSINKVEIIRRVYDTARTKV